MFNPYWKMLTTEKVDDIINNIIHERTKAETQEERLELDDLKRYWEETRSKIVLFEELIK